MFSSGLDCCANCQFWREDGICARDYLNRMVNSSDVCYFWEKVE